MKKDIVPLTAAVFLVIGGLMSGFFISNSKAGTIEVASSHRNGEFFIPAAQGAETAGALIGERAPSPMFAVSNSDILESRSIFFTALGAVKDPGVSAENGLAQ
jgi:hypothetical protein